MILVQELSPETSDLKAYQNDASAQDMQHFEEQLQALSYGMPLSKDIGAIGAKREAMLWRFSRDQRILGGRAIMSAAGVQRADSTLTELVSIEDNRSRHKALTENLNRISGQPSSIAGIHYSLITHDGLLADRDFVPVCNIVHGVCDPGSREMRVAKMTQATFKSLACEITDEAAMRPESFHKAQLHSSLGTFEEGRFQPIVTVLNSAYYPPGIRAIAEEQSLQ